MPSNLKCSEVEQNSPACELMVSASLPESSCHSKTTLHYRRKKEKINKRRQENYLSRKRKTGKVDPATKKQKNLKRTRNWLQNDDNKIRNRERAREWFLVDKNKATNQKRSRERYMSKVDRTKNLEQARQRLKNPLIVQRNRLKRKERSTEANVVQIFSQWRNFRYDYPLEFICTSCEQLFFRVQVTGMSAMLQKGAKALKGVFPFDEVRSVNNKLWACRTCESYLKKDELPSQSYMNGVHFKSVPPSLIDLSLIEERFVASRCPFVKVFVRSGGQMCWASGILNVPNFVTGTIKRTPRNLEDDLLVINFKRRIGDEHNYMSNYGRLSAIIEAANTLRTTALIKLHGTEVDPNWKPEIEIKPDENLLNDQQVEDELGHIDALILQEQFEPQMNKAFNLAPWEGFTPMFIFLDKFAEELAYPKLLAGKPRNAVHKIPLTYGDYCQIEMRRRDLHFRRHAENWCFKVKKLQCLQVSSKASLAMRNMAARSLKNGGIFDFMQSNRTLEFLKQQRMSLAYYANIKRNCFAWGRHLGKATFFQTFSMPEGHWPHLLRVLIKSKFPIIVVPDNDGLLCLSFNEKLELITSYPVAIIRFFNAKIKWLLKNLLQSNLSPLGKVSGFYGCVEAQHRGSLHLHIIVFVENAPNIKNNTDNAFINFIDKCVSTSIELPEPDGVNLTAEQKLFPQKYQLHFRTENCRKKGKQCHYCFPKYPIKSTQILRQLPVDIPGEVLNHYDGILVRINEALKNLTKGKDCHYSFERFYLCVMLSMKTIFLQFAAAWLRLLSSWDGNLMQIILISSHSFCCTCGKETLIQIYFGYLLIYYVHNCLNEQAQKGSQQSCEWNEETCWWGSAEQEF